MVTSVENHVIPSLHIPLTYFSISNEILNKLILIDVQLSDLRIVSVILESDLFLLVWPGKSTKTPPVYLVRNDFVN